MTDLEKIDEVADAVDGTVQEDYFGRGMFGRSCVAVYCEDHVTCIEEAAQRGLTGASYDQMGKGMVVYWPRIQK